MNKKQKKIKACLRCSKEFKQQSRFNRICPSCADANVKRYSLKADCYNGRVIKTESSDRY